MGAGARKATKDTAPFVLPAVISDSTTLPALGLPVPSQAWRGRPDMAAVSPRLVRRWQRADRSRTHPKGPASRSKHDGPTTVAAERGRLRESDFVAHFQPVQQSAAPRPRQRRVPGGARARTAFGAGSRVAAGGAVPRTECRRRGVGHRVNRGPAARGRRRRRRSAACCYARSCSRRPGCHGGRGCLLCACSPGRGCANRCGFSIIR